MVEAVMLWNEPNNLSHWDFEIDAGWATFSRMVKGASAAIAGERSALTRVLGGISPIDPGFVKTLDANGVLDAVDVAVHGFPLDWNHWQIHEWPDKLAEIRAVTWLPLWVPEVGRVDVRSRGGAGVRIAAHRGTADGQGRSHPLVQPVRSSARVAGDDASPRSGGVFLLSSLLHGALTDTVPGRSSGSTVRCARSSRST